MDTHEQRWRLGVLVVLVSVAVVLTGCAALDTQAATPEPPAPEEVAQRYGSLSDISGTVNNTIVYENGTTETRLIDQQYNLQTGYTRTNIVSADSPEEGDILAYNGTFIWEYDASRNEVRLLEYSGRSQRANSNRVMTAPEVFEFLREEGTVTVHRSGDEEVNPLPAVPVTERSGVPRVARNETYTVSYRGTGTVDNRETHVVELNGTGRWVSNRTIHYDSEWFYPVKSTVVVDRPRATYSIVARYENMTFNPNLSADDYSFDPPANVTRITRSQGPKSSDTYEELTKRAIMPVPEPEFPDSFKFQTGYEQFGNFSGVQLQRYANGEGQHIWIAKFDSMDVVSSVNDERDTEAIQLCGVTAYYIEQEDENQLLWKERAAEYGPSSTQHQYRIGGNVEKSVLLTVARSIQC